VIREQQGIPKRMDVDAIARRSSEPLAAGTRHPVPEVPFIANGIVYDPKDISRFDGRQLLYVDSRNGLLVYTEVYAADLLLQTNAMAGQIQEALLVSDRPDHVLAPDESEPWKFPWQNY
jgi:hypothetical protein